jgi:murein DD-endopeptidase MepM/ murein hydrolase activator NlpD
MMRATLALGAAALLLAATPAVAAPCPSGLPVAGQVSSGFGIRHGRMHPGVDLRAPVGTPVHAAAGGTVVFAGRYYHYGLLIEIEHQDGSRARYAHLSRFAPGLVAGRAVRGGEQIGAVGRTGRTTGAHLHVELRREGRAVDPWPWMTGTACNGLSEIAEAPRR